MMLLVSITSYLDVRRWWLWLLDLDGGVLVGGFVYQKGQWSWLVR
jgi:hypothetical protein